MAKRAKTPKAPARRRSTRAGGADGITDSTTAYARHVLADKIITGRPVRLACERHVRDLKTGHQRGLSFNVRDAEFAIQFFSFLRLAEGEHAGKPFILSPFQRFIVGSLFGWKGEDGYRRFRTAYIEIGKGSGKSPLAAGIGVYGLVADGEQGAEIYAAAVMRDQARIVFSDAEKMVSASDALSSRVQVTVNNLAVLKTNSYFRPVSSEGRGLDGKRVHMAIVDELHEHPSATVVDKMRAGTKGRRQPLIVEITNSGYDRTSVCWQHHEYSIKVLEGSVDNDSWFAYVCQLDEGDDWRDEATWIKANPNLGVSITHKYLREQVAEAIGMPAKQNIVKRLNFCFWTEQADRWIDMDVWTASGARGPVDETALARRDAYLGMDMSTTSDITALAAVFPRDEAIDGAAAPRFRAVFRFWIPRVSLAARSERERLLLEAWAAQGLIKITEGNVTDYDVVRADINALGDQFAIKELAYDPWNATQLATQLQGDGFTIVPFRQGFASMTEPTKELDKLVKSADLDHGGNPVAAWMASNVSVAQDAAGNLKPDKSTSADRIDGIVSLIMAIGRATIQPGQSTSVYNTRDGIFFL